MVTIAIRGLKLLWIGHFGDYGRVDTESAIRSAPMAFTAFEEGLGFDLDVGKSDRGATLQVSGVTVRVDVVG